MRSAKPPIRYKISSPLQAVKLEERPGSTLRDPTPTLIQIPTNSILEAEGAVGHSGLMNVLWDGQAFSVFYEDLRDNAEILSAAEA
jgi:hypothetical protein